MIFNFKGADLRRQNSWRERELDFRLSSGHSSPFIFMTWAYSGHLFIYRNIGNRPAWGNVMASQANRPNSLAYHQ